MQDGERLAGFCGDHRFQFCFSCFQGLHAGLDPIGGYAVNQGIDQTVQILRDAR